MTDAPTSTPTAPPPVDATVSGPGVFRIPDGLREQVDSALERAIAERWASRIWERQSSLWSADEGVQAKIAGRLGWLDAPAAFTERIVQLEGFAEGVRSEGFGQAVVCGMGGSSLAPEVLARTQTPTTEGLPIVVLDSTDPAAVIATHESWDPASTLYLVATKSGTTSETLAFLEYFWEVEDELHGKIPDSVPGEHFVAITDPGKSRDSIPHADAFRSVFLNPEDVGGRYSALTFVGLVPGSIQGLDLERLLGDARRMADATRIDDARNPGLVLGSALGALARAGRDKLTLIADPVIEPLGAWLEQLIAESTGKAGTGIVPVDREPLGDVASYGPDRVFVRIAREGAAAWRAETDGLLDGLAAAGHPVIDLALPGDGAIGAEFFRWEFATAVAGAGLGINPFDEPNVTESKENTRRVLEDRRDTGAFPAEAPLASDDRLTLFGDAPLRITAGPGTIEGELARHMARARPSGYIGIHAYFASLPERDAAISELRRRIRDATRMATTAGYGPRFLHSTGQLHKGGQRTGLYIQLVVDHPADVPIPGSQETFGALIDAQALGDFASLETHELPVLRVHLGLDPEAGLARLAEALERALR